MKPGLLKCWILILILLILPGCRSGSHQPAGSESLKAETDLIILSTTDMHGKCWETNILTGTPENHNMLRVSTAVQEIRAA